MKYQCLGGLASTPFDTSLVKSPTIDRSRTYFVNVNGEGFLPRFPAFLLVSCSDGFLGLAGFLDSFS